MITSSLPRSLSEVFTQVVFSTGGNYPSSLHTTGILNDLNSNGFLINFYVCVCVFVLKTFLQNNSCFTCTQIPVKTSTEFLWHAFYSAHFIHDFPLLETDSEYSYVHVNSPKTFKFLRRDVIEFAFWYFTTLWLALVRSSKTHS